MNQPTSRRSGPKYLLFADRIRKNIRENRYEKGKPIPLNEDPGLETPKNKTVVRRALDLLEREGWLHHDDKRGWLAWEPLPIRGVALEWDPAETMPSSSLETVVRVLSKVAATLPAEYLEHFEIHGVEGKRASRIVKVHLENEKPVAVESIVAPSSQFPGLVMRDHRHENIYRTLAQGYGVRITRIAQTVHIRRATDEEARALAVEPKTKVLAIDRVLFGGEFAVAMVRLAYPDLNRGVSDESGTHRRRSDISR